MLRITRPETTTTAVADLCHCRCGARRQIPIGLTRSRHNADRGVVPQFLTLISSAPFRTAFPAPKPNSVDKSLSEKTCSFVRQTVGSAPFVTHQLKYRGTLTCVAQDRYFVLVSGCLSACVPAFPEPLAYGLNSRGPTCSAGGSRCQWPVWN